MGISGWDVSMVAWLSDFLQTYGTFKNVPKKITQGVGLMGRVIAVISGKGGVGKTTTTANLSSLLAKHGHDVIAIDGNLTTPNLGIHLGLAAVSPTLHDVMLNRAKIYQAMHYHPTGLKLFPGSLRSTGLDPIDPRDLGDIVREIRDAAEFVFIDAAAGLGKEALSALDAADEVLLIVNPELPSVLDALKTIKVARSMGKRVLGAIVTRRGSHKNELSKYDIAEFLEVPVIEEIPEDPAVKESIRHKNPVVHHHPTSKSSRAYHRLASYFSGKIIKPPEKWYHKLFLTRFSP